MGLTLNRYEVSFENDQNVLELDCCDDVWHSEYTKNHWAVHFEMVDSCELHLSTKIMLNKQKNSQENSVKEEQWVWNNPAKHWAYRVTWLPYSSCDLIDSNIHGQLVFYKGTRKIQIL